MDQLLFHPKVVHVPLALAFLMPLIAGGVVFAYLRGWLDRRVWVVVLLLQGAMLGTGLVAMNTGEREEEVVEAVVPERHIDAHEDAAELFVWASAIVFLLMGVPLVLKEGELGNALMIFACLGSVAVLGLAYRAGEAGGRLVYQHGAANAYIEAAKEASDARLEAIDEYEEDVDSEE